MNFCQLQFHIFLLIILLFFVLIKNNVYRKTILLIAGYYFYSLFDYRFVPLILASTLTDYYVGRALYMHKAPSPRRLLLLLSLSVNLTILGFFKYYNFFINSFTHLFGLSNSDDFLLHIALPLGISYYTFQTLTYTIDVYNRRLAPCDNLLDYALFVSFFPSIMSGPIVRASNLLPQMKTTRILNYDSISSGLGLFIIGLFMKVFMADRLGMFVDVVFINPRVFSCLTVWLAVVSYSLQLYLDFAGYSNMAIGIAKMLGYDIGVNFNFPYVSTSISEFWKRWHISLSTWIRDYLYIPFGGSKKGEIRTYCNLLSAMLLCGLWHGPSWAFVLWGGYHGLSLCIQRLWSRLDARLPAFIAWLLTMLTVMLGWVLFRSADLSHAAEIFKQLFFPAPGVVWVFPFALFAVAATAVVHLAEISGKVDIHDLSLDAWYTPAFLFAMLWMVVIFHPEGFRPFVYAGF